MNIGPFDKQLELRDVADGAETSTASETGIALDVLKADHFDAIINVTALGTADADEVYTLTV